MVAAPLAYFRGEFLPASDAKVGVMTHALHYGTAVFEGIRSNWNSEEQKHSVFRPREHYVRLHDSCNILRMHLQYNVDELLDITKELIQKSGFKEDLYIRPLVFKSEERVANLKLHELSDDFVLLAVPLGNYIDTRAARCIVSGWRRIDESMVPTRVKISGNYINGILAKTDAILAGYDEAILLNDDGSVAEGTGENIFIVRNNIISTPPISSNALPGITRDCVMHLAVEELGLTVEEREIGRGELYLADEVFFTGTAAHLTAVGEIDNRSIGNGDVGEITGALQDLYFTLIRGSNKKYRHWCLMV
ncbi:MAG: branched chain amino acid aminotransferase [Chloroflexi bacterium]|nr:branched chain amino acid aminotransferase [Chloroflexota bacterium]